MLIPHRTTTINALRRRHDGTPNRIPSARMPPPLQAFHVLGPDSMKALLLFAAFVFTVKVVEALPPPEILTLFGLRLQVGRFCAPVGDAMSAQLKLTVPE
jgi:hypothetical protein